MKTRALVYSLVLFLALPFIGFAADQATPRNAEPAAAERQFSGKIASLEPATKTVTLGDANKNSQTVRIGDRTRITRGGSMAKWEDLSVGMLIEGTCVGEGSNTFATAVNIK